MGAEDVPKEAATTARIHPSLGLPGDSVLYTPQPLFSTRSSDEAASLTAPWKVTVPGADIPNIFAHRQWRAGMLLADLIVHGGIDVRDKVVIELGAGTGLPSIAAAAAQATTPPRFVLCTDYDSAPLIATLRDNVRRNVAQSVASRVRVAGHTWGMALDDVEDLLPPTIQPAKADVILLADCIWDGLSHAALVKSVTHLLRKDADARVYIVSGLHTGRGNVEAFLRRACRAGLQLTDLPPLIGCKTQTHWPTLDADQDAVREAQLDASSSDTHLARCADLIYEMEIAQETDCVTEDQHGRTWQSLHSRLTGGRRTFLLHEREEERPEVGGVHLRNRWITFSALRWSEPHLPA